MNYLKISNKGELDLRLLSLIGGTTKDEDTSKIGQFGTGLKYSLSYLLRSGINFKLFIGVREVEFSTKKDTIQGKEFDRIVIDGEQTSITTKYGCQWDTWEMIREIWCNAVDEGSERKKVTTDGSIIKGDIGRTTFFIEMNEKVSDVVNNWSEYFIAEKPLFENEDFAIYPNKTDKMRIYKNGVLTKIYDQPSIFKYDFKKSEINELRQYMGYPQYDVPRALIKGNKEVVSLFLMALKKGAKVFESELSFDNVYPFMYDESQLKDSFSGWLFLDPSSDESKSIKSVKVPKKLFKILQSCGLPCERIYKATGSGGYYGGSIEKDKLEYKKVSNNTLSSEITRIMSSRSLSLPFEVVVPINDKFDFLINGGSIIFSSDIETYSTKDLEAVVSIACAVSLSNSSVYDIAKRLVKLNLSNQNFKNIILGK